MAGRNEESITADLLDPSTERIEAGARTLRRLSELMELEPGWLDGEGDAVSALALAAAILVLRCRPDLRDDARIFPMPDGGIVIECTIGNWDLSIECSPIGAFELYGVEAEGDGVLASKSYSSLSSSLFVDLDAMAHRG